MAARFCQRPSLTLQGISSRMMARSTLDASPPIHRGMTDRLDKDVFRKSLQVLAARVPPSRAGAILKAGAMKRTIIDLPKVKSVVPGPDDQRLVLLRFSHEADLSPEAREFLKSESAELTTHTIDLDYDYWTADDILHAILPEDVVEGAPSGFAAVGHIAHLNLNAEYLPYKHVIGQVILDKNPKIKTVVNKLDNIDTKFRFFKMELLAGEPNYVVEHSESNCRFTFDFTQVYWNSRLHTEHERLVKMFKPEDVIADVFAGVGPFAIPAAKKGCGVFANDLNPMSYKYLQKNVTDNKVTPLVRPFCEDGKEFIRRVIVRALECPLPPVVPPKSKSQLKAEQRVKQQAQEPASSPTTDALPALFPRNRITQFVMNLPDSAIQFLDAFRGVLSKENAGEWDLSGVYDNESLPTVHCYCFTRELDPEKAAADIRQRVEEKLGGPLGSDVALHLVRSVAPNKEMYCISFTLPPQVAFGA